MIINGLIGGFTFNASSGYPVSISENEDTTLVGFNGVEIIARCRNILGSNYLLKEITMKDFPNIDNQRISDIGFEGVEFLDSRFTEKSLSFTAYMKPGNGKTIASMTEEIKDTFHKISGVLSYNYRGEIMTTNARVASLTFDTNARFKTFTVNFVCEPYFESQNTKTLTKTSTGVSDTIGLGNVSHRVEPSLDITVSGGPASGVTIGNSVINTEIINGDVISYDFSTNKALLNGSQAVIQGKQNYLGQDASFSISFLDKVTTPSYNQSILAYGANTINSQYYVTTSTNYETMRHLFPNTINFLKGVRIKIQTFSSFSLIFSVNIYNGIGGTLLYSEPFYIYGGTSVNGFYDFVLSDYVDISSHPNIYLEITSGPLQYTGSVYLRWYRTDPGTTGIGTSYDENGTPLTSQMAWEFLGYSAIPTDTVENVSGFTTSLTYKDKYV